MLGAIYERQKKFDQAEQQFRKVLEVNPDNAAVLNYYGYMLADRGVRLDEADSHDPAGREAGTEQRRLSRQPRLGVLQAEQAPEAEENLRKSCRTAMATTPPFSAIWRRLFEDWAQTNAPPRLMERALAEWQKALPADYEADKVTELEAQLKTLKKRLAQKSSPESAKPQ